MKRNRVTLTCEFCDSPFDVPRSHAERASGAPKYCKKRCMDAARQRFTPWNPLQRRAERKRVKEGLSLLAFAKLVGIGEAGYRLWLKHVGRAASEEAIRRVAAWVDPQMPYADALKDAGGETAEQRHRRVGKASAEREAFINARADEAKQKAANDKRRRTLKAKAAFRRGDPQTPEVKAAIEKETARRKRIRAAHKTRLEADSERATALAQRSKAWRSSAAGQVLTRLAVFLRHHPAPTDSELKAAAAQASRSTGLPISAVLRTWRETLRQRGLHPRGIDGPKLREDRHRFIEQFMESRGLGRANRKPRNFWHDAAAEWNKVGDPGTALDGPSFEHWYKSHLKRCPKTYFRRAA